MPAHACTHIIYIKVMGKDTVNDVVKAFKKSFGKIEFEAVNHKTGQVVRSEGWRPIRAAKSELDAEQFLKLKFFGEDDD